MKKSLAIFLLLLYLLSLPGGFFAAGVGKAVVIAAPGAYDEDVRLDRIEGKKVRAQYEEEIRTWDPLQAYEPAGGEADGGGVIAGLKGKIGELLEKLWKKGKEIAAKVWGWLKGVEPGRSIGLEAAAAWGGGGLGIFAARGTGADFAGESD